MSEIAEILKELNIPPEKLQDFAQRVQQNPMSALSLIQELKISPEVLQKLMAIIMSNPMAIANLAKEMGFSNEQMAMVENQMQNLKQRLSPQSFSSGSDNSESN